MTLILVTNRQFLTRRNTETTTTARDLDLQI